MTLSDLASRAAAELRDAVAAIDPAAMEGMVSDLARARRRHRLLHQLQYIGAARLANSHSLHGGRQG